MEIHDIQQYLLVNKEIDMSIGKFGVQTAHAAARFERAVAGKQEMPLFDEASYRQWVGGIEKKITVGAKPGMLEKLEAEGWISVRDAGLNELGANTLTVVVSPPIRKQDAPKWLQRLQVYGKPAHD